MAADLAAEHDVLWDGVKWAAEMPDDDHVSTRLLYKNGVAAKLYLGDFARAALRAA